MDQAMKDPLWKDKVGNHAQIGGIETSVLDNGPGRGLRIAWVNTGSGLRYKVVIDRCLDIADAFYNQHSLAWISHGGVSNPNPAAVRGLEWLYSFGGGLLTTCGLTHIGAPESDGSNERGIHGRVSNLRANIESIIQPDPGEGKLDMSITAVVKQSMVFGPSLELRRTISSTLGKPVIKIHDEVKNCGNTAAPHMILYHCNFGWPLVDEGADIVCSGSCEPAGRDFDNELFNETHNYKKCQPPLDSHKGFGEACGFIDIDADKDGMCHAGLVNNKLPLAVAMKFAKQQLPALTNWQHWGPGEYVCALEPGTNPPIGQNKARQQNELIYIEPGEKKIYELEISVLTDKQRMEEFANTAG
jgi:hypothetical protein